MVEPSKPQASQHLLKVKDQQDPAVAQERRARIACQSGEESVERLQDDVDALPELIHGQSD